MTTNTGASEYREIEVTSRLCEFIPQDKKAPPCKYSTTRPVPSAGSTPGARTSCAVAVGNVTVARTAGGVGTIAEQANSTNPNGQGRCGMRLPSARAGLIVSRDSSATIRLATLGPTMSRTAGRRSPAVAA
ncbi:hypothetical protein MUNTM_09980 [Mycobacterium sp. MUNTM1]